jgi:hypothetical protein
MKVAGFDQPSTLSAKILHYCDVWRAPAEADMKGHASNAGFQVQKKIGGAPYQQQFNEGAFGFLADDRAPRINENDVRFGSEADIQHGEQNVR